MKHKSFAKHLLSTALCAALTVLCLCHISIEVQAASESDLTFKLNEDGESYSVTDCSTSASGELVIPSTYNGKPVTLINASSFWSCDNLTSIVIPDCVTSIGGSAFFGCNNLINVAIPDSVTIIHDDAFAGCSSLTNIIIPNSVLHIGGDAFSGCRSLASITIPNSVVYIGEDAFAGCISLTGITIPSSITVIDKGTFDGCTSLTSITIPDSISVIDEEAFSGCTSLDTIVLGNSVRTIESNAFFDCSSLTSITIPDSVVNIGEDAFYGCISLSYVNTPDLAAWCDISFANGRGNPIYYTKDLYWNDELVTDVVVPDGAISIGRYAFYGCNSLRSITIPNGVTEINESAFSNCNNLTNIIIPDSVTTIGRFAFENCVSLISINIGNGVAYLAEKAFFKCAGLQSVIIGNSVRTIYEQTFYDCSSLESVTISSSVAYIKADAFYGCLNLSSVYITDLADWCNIRITNEYSNPLYYADNLYLNGELVVDIEIPDGVSSIDAYMFSCTSLISVTIPDSVTTIAAEAFSGCSNLERITIPFIGYDVDFDSSFGHIFGCSSFPNSIAVTQKNDITYYIPASLKSVTVTGGNVPNYAFSNCSNLESIILSNTVTIIGEKAFSNCSSLTSITIPNNVTYIGSSAFSGCTSLKSFTIPDKITYVSNYMFDGCNGLTNITIPDGATSIGYNAFSNCSKLTSIIIPGGVTSIGRHAFSGCTNLNEITIPDGVTCIDDYLFSDCSNLTSVTIPDSVTEIGYNSFYGCEKLITITLPKEITSIGGYAFSHCSSLTSISIPKNITTIGSHTFYNCSSLTSITIPTGVSSIGVDAFSGCSNLRQIYFEGDAPAFESIEYLMSYTFKGVTATAYYPTNTTWTEDKLQNYGGNITWVPYTPVQFEITGQPTTQKVADGKPAKFTVSATGDNITYQWQYRTSSSGSWKNASAAGNKTAALSVPATVSRSSYQYRCVITDGKGNKLYSKTVHLYVLGVKTQPVTQKVADGNTAKFTVSATGASKKYQWQYRTSDKGSWKNASATGNKTATLSVPASVSRNGYQYRCRVTDSAGNKVYTKTVTLYVLGIKTQPVSKTVVDGRTAKFTVAATGSGLKYQWQYRTSSSGSWKNASATGNKTKTLSVPASVSRHGYQYRCKITDSAGNTVYTKAVSLYVLGIKTQPASKTVKAGATAKFTVKATGKGLTYQWQYKAPSGSWKNVSAASGKKATYSLTAAARHNGYQYRCKITDSAGNIIYSKIVKLTVK